MQRHSFGLLLQVYREKGLTIYQLHNSLGHATSNQNSTINPIRPFQFSYYFLVLPISQEPCGRAAKLLDRKRLHA